MSDTFLLLIYLVMGIYTVLHLVVAIQDIYTTHKKVNHRNKVKLSNIELVKNHPEERYIEKFEHWKRHIEQKYVDYGQEHPGIFIPYYSTIKYPPDWNMRRLYIAELYDYKCAICSKYDKLGHTHHLNPLSKGGNNSIENLVYLCRFCHEEQHWHMKLKKDKRRREVAKLGITEEEYLVKKRNEYINHKEVDTYKHSKISQQTKAVSEISIEDIFG